MKKGLFVVLFIALIAVFATPKQGSAFGIGGIFGDPTGLSLSFNPIVIGINYNFISSSYFQFHLDYWFINRGLGSGLKWYLGFGGKIQIFGNDTLGVGLRVPIGLQFFPARRFELFAEYVPGVSIIPGIGYDHDWGIGFRFHI